MAIRHFLDLSDIAKADLRAILDEAHRAKKARAGWPKGKVDDDAPLAGRTLAMIFEKSSTRTRFSFDMAMRQLGGSSITATANDMQLGRGETIEDTARVLSRYVDAVMIRANRHADVLAFAEAASVPVVNGLTDHNHPCQIIADLMTIEEHGHAIESCIAWVGDGNNVARSFVNAATKFEMHLHLCSPEGYKLEPEFLKAAEEKQAFISQFDDPKEAAKDCEVIVADTFVSMGDKDADKRLKDLMPYQVTDDIMAQGVDNALFLHCLPAHRGEEVSAAVIDGPASRVFDEAENRLHAQKAILRWCFGV